MPSALGEAPTMHRFPVSEWGTKGVLLLGWNIGPVEIKHLLLFTSLQSIPGAAFTPKITEEFCSHVLLWHPRMGCCGSTFFLQYCNVCSMVKPYTSIMKVTTQAITWGPVSIGNCKEQYSLSFSSKNLSWSHERNAPKWFHVQLTNEDFSRLQYQRTLQVYLPPRVICKNSVLWDNRKWAPTLSMRALPNHRFFLKTIETSLGVNNDYG